MAVVLVVLVVLVVQVVLVVVVVVALHIVANGGTPFVLMFGTNFP